MIFSNYGKVPTDECFSRPINRSLGHLLKTMRKRCLSAKFPHHEIR